MTLYNLKLPFLVIKKCLIIQYFKRLIDLQGVQGALYSSLFSAQTTCLLHQITDLLFFKRIEAFKQFDNMIKKDFPSILILSPGHFFPYATKQIIIIIFRSEIKNMIIIKQVYSNSCI